MADNIGFKGQNLDQMIKSSAVPTTGFFMFRDPTESDKSKAYKTISFPNLKSQLDILAGTEGTTSWVSNCYTMPSTGGSFDLPSTPIAATLQIWIDYVPQFKPDNYSLSGETITFNGFTLPAGKKVCYSYAESLGLSSAIQDLQAVTDVGAVTDKEITALSLKFGGTSGNVKNSAGGILLQAITAGLGIQNAAGLQVARTESDNFYLPEKLTVAKAVKLTGYLAANPGDRDYLYVDSAGNLLQDNNLNLQKVMAKDNDTTLDVQFTAGSTTDGFVGMNAGNDIYLKDTNGRGMTIKAATGNGSIRFNVGDLTVSEKAYISSAGLFAVGKSTVLDTSKNLQLSVEAATAGNQVVSSQVTGTDGKDLIFFTRDNGLESFRIKSSGLSRFFVRTGTPDKAAYFTSDGDLVEGDIVSGGATVSGTDGQILKKNGSNANGSVISQSGTAITIAGLTRFTSRTGTPATSAFFNSSGDLVEGPTISWTNLPLGGGLSGNARYTKDIHGFVHLEGSVNSVPAGTNVTIGTLPAGFRPSVLRNFVQSRSTSTTGFRTVSVETGGVIQTDMDVTDIVYLDGITFYAG